MKTDAGVQSNNAAPMSERMVPGPTWSSLVAGIAAAALTGLAGWFVAGRFSPNDAWAAWPAAGADLLAALLGLGVMRVWAPRTMARWATAFLGAQAVRFFTAIALAFVLLYSLPASARVVGGLTFAAGYFAVLAAETWTAARHFRLVLEASPSHTVTDSSD